jgi:yecA family protein
MADDREKLAELMGRHNPTGPLGGSVTRLHGFFTSVVSGPMVMPSEWLPVVFRGDTGAVSASADDARDGMSLAMRFYNEVASDLGPDGRYSIMVDRVGQEDGGDQPLPLAIEWARGYMIGVNVRPDAWNAAIEDTHIGRSFETIYRVHNPPPRKLTIQSRNGRRMRSRWTRCPAAWRESPAGGERSWPRRARVLS